MLFEEADYARIVANSEVTLGSTVPVGREAGVSLASRSIAEARFKSIVWFVGLLRGTDVVLIEPEENAGGDAA
jgi:hypothetical protein